MANLSATPEFTSLRDQATHAFNDALGRGITGGFDEQFSDSAAVAQALYDVKLAVSSIYEYPALWTGPRTTAFTQVNFSHEALDDIMKPPRAADFRTAIETVLWLMDANRDNTESGPPWAGAPPVYRCTWTGWVRCSPRP